jgi:hypothetical protein
LLEDLEGIGETVLLYQGEKGWPWARHQITRSPDHQITRSPDHQITRSPDHQITRSPDHQITRMDPHQQRLFDVFDLRRYAPAGDVGTTPNRRSKTPGPAETMAKPGANFMIAETGTLVVVESEGNGRMCLTMPETLISVVGIEKILPPVTPSAVVGVLAVGSRPHPLSAKLW